VTEYPWLSVSGFGTHIKSTQTTLIIRRKNSVEEYPLDSIKNLLVIGGHTISTSTITNLVKKGAYITFFDPDCTPIGIIRPFGDKSDMEIHRIQQAIPRHRYATAIAQAAIKSRLFAIERIQEEQNSSLFYEGEQHFLHTSEQELQYLIKLDEIRRLHRLTADMYYEIMSRNIPPDFGYRRRTIRPQSDPVNAMLSFGYAMLFGNCCVSLIGSRLDPDSGLMYEGKGSLVQDLIEPLKADMIDRVVYRIARESLSPSDFEQTPGRCMLSDDLIHQLIGFFHSSIDNKKIDELVYTFYQAMMNTGEFIIRY
jgi:CRISPR-associated endonuclease Cas1